MMDIEIGAEMEKEREGAVELKPCPFCGRSMKYKEARGAFVWDVFIEHDYNKNTLYIPCPMAFFRHIPWKDRVTGEVFDEGWVKRQKQLFIEEWNRRVKE